MYVNISRYRPETKSRSMTSSDLESRSRSPICELDLCLVVRNQHTEFEDPSSIISRDIVRKRKCDGQTDGRTDRQTDGKGKINMSPPV